MIYKINIIKIIIFYLNGIKWWLITKTWFIKIYKNNYKILNISIELNNY